LTRKEIHFHDIRSNADSHLFLSSPNTHRHTHIHTHRHTHTHLPPPSLPLTLPPSFSFPSSHYNLPPQDQYPLLLLLLAAAYYACQFPPSVLSSVSNSSLTSIHSTHCTPDAQNSPHAQTIAHTRTTPTSRHSPLDCHMSRIVHPSSLKAQLDRDMQKKKTQGHMQKKRHNDG
jgi:hypothetical protein